MKKKRTVMFLLFVAWLAVVALPTPAAGAQDPQPPLLSGKLEALDWYAASEPLNLRFTLRNLGPQSVWVLAWQLPGPDIDADILEASCDGSPVPYVGPLVKRAAPTAEDYVEIPAGGAYSVVFDPSAVYDMNRGGQYAVRYRLARIAVRRQAPEILPAEETDPMSLRPAPIRRPLRQADSLPTEEAVLEAASGVSLWFEGVPAALQQAPDIAQTIGGYNKCTTAQQTALQTAHANAITISGKAISHLTANPTGSTLYAYWFGTYLSSRFAIVDAHYDAINDAFRNKSVVYDCGCKKNYYAYVYPTQPYKIYLCKVFWTAPALGRDCKAGTLVHEMSHFNVTASTDDYVYGASGAHNLALTDPAKAVDNADNHEYFAEDQ